MSIHQNFFITTAVLFACFDFITILFSLITIIIIITHWRSECRSIANLLACNSCFAILFYAIVSSIQIPFIFQPDLIQSKSIHTTFCHIRAFLITYATSVKTYSYVIQAISRFLIIFNNKQQFLLTFRFNGIMIILSWVVSGIIAGGMFISPTAYQYESESHLCGLSTRNFRTSFVAIVVIFFFTTNTTVILYSIILFYAKRYNRISPNSTNTLQSNRNIKVFRKIFIFITILLIGGTPYLLLVILNRINEAPWPLYSISILFIACAAAIESIALLFTNKQVKKIFLTKFSG